MEVEGGGGVAVGEVVVAGLGADLEICGWAVTVSDGGEHVVRDGGIVGSHETGYVVECCGGTELLGNCVLVGGGTCIILSASANSDVVGSEAWGGWRQGALVHLDVCEGGAV